jgi:hypothetical protein
MKKLLLQAFVGCAALLPFSQLQAAVPGGYPSGYKFTLKVKSKITSKTVGTKVTKNVPVPAGIANYKVGQKVTFTIGSKGEIKTPAFSVPFNAKSSTASSNSYLIVPKASTDMKATSVLLIKDSTTKAPAGVNYLYVNTKRTGFTATTISVDYGFE